MRTGIALIGFMGTGKTAVGRVLAEKLGKEFVELDAVIERLAGKSIPAVFRDDGEIRFRELEIEAARDAANKENTVIACGGGIVLNKINIDRLKQRHVIVLLEASPAVILKRTAADNGRPLLDVADRRRQVDDLLRFRRPFYRAAAEITVSTSRLGIDAAAYNIIKLWRVYESNG